jgi:hypothetical protein
MVARRHVGCRKVNNDPSGPAMIEGDGLVDATTGN